MTRNTINVNLDLERIRCHDEGDGWGSAEPYLWTVFFKIDGQTVRVSESLTLIGAATTSNTPGSHGNLGDTDVDEGDTVIIPAAIGEWQTTLIPIPVAESLTGLLDDLGGVVGVVTILMEEDNVSDDGANAGHQALNSAVRDTLQAIIDTRSISNQDVSEAEINGFTAAIESKIRDAIVDQQNAFENLWSWINPDDTIGVKVFIFKHDDLDPATTLNFSHRWRNEGDWEIFGHITSVPLCPANAFNEIISRKGSAGDQSVSQHTVATDMARPLVDIDVLRSFRDGPYREMAGLAHWFGLAERHVGRVARIAMTQPDLLVSMRTMLEWGKHIVQQPDARLSPEHVEHAARLLQALAKHRNRRARIDARRALDVLEALKGSTHREALAFLSTTVPARHPTVAGNRHTRILPRPRSTGEHFTKE